MTVSRSFGRPVYSLEALNSALATFAARAAERARRHGLRAGDISVHFGWREDERPVLKGDSMRLPPTNDTPSLIRAAKALAEKLFVEGRAYKKAGVVLADLEPADITQSDFFDDGSGVRSSRLSQTVDQLNAMLGAGALRYGGEKSSTSWGSRCESQSPCWTTRWEDLKSVRAAM